MSARPSADFGNLVAQHGSDAFRLLVESMRDYAIFMLDTEGRVASWNLGAQRIKGYRADEIIGQHFSRFYTPDALAVGWPDEELRRARELGRFEDEGWRVRSDGTRFWANVIITALRDTQGHLLGYSKITRDLTERRAQEERLRLSEERFRLLVEGVKDHAIFLIDADGAVLNWNAGAERVLGFTADAVVGRSWALLFTDEDLATRKPEAELSIARHAGYSEDTGWRRRADGTRFWADNTLTALHDGEGAHFGYAQVVRDLSERRRMQELEAEGRRINEFIAMLAHELRNPLAPIGNAVGILEKVADTPELLWCSKLIGRQVIHLSRLVDDLLDVSRITSGKIQLRREALDLNAVVRTAVESVRPVVSGYGHALEVELTGQAIPLEGDATRLVQVVINLLNNAAKYTPRGGRVQVRAERLDSVATIHVIDNGIGMSKKLIEAAFDMFVQGDRALDRAEGGLGIGLTLVKRIVEMHGGTVSASSAGQDKGSHFAVQLPLASTPASALRPVAAARSVHRARKILIVDDNEDAAQSLATLLRMSGHVVMVAGDGPQALQAAAVQPPDTVLLDLGLPGMDGYTVARRLRAVPGLGDVRVIAMTGYGQETHRRAAADAGFQSYLVKPVDAGQLLELLDTPAANTP